MMFALSAEYEMAALIASILFGFGAAVWVWMELNGRRQKKGPAGPVLQISSLQSEIYFVGTPQILR